MDGERYCRFLLWQESISSDKAIAGDYTTLKIEEDEARVEILNFSPDLIIYRPVPDVMWLHKFSMQIIEELSIPLITWIMDDWPVLAKRDGENSKILIDDFISY